MERDRRTQRRTTEPLPTEHGTTLTGEASHEQTVRVDLRGHQIFAADENSSDGMLVLRCSPCSAGWSTIRPAEALAPPGPNLLAVYETDPELDRLIEVGCSIRGDHDGGAASVNASTKPAPIALAPAVTTATSPWKSSTAPTSGPRSWARTACCERSGRGFGLARAVRVEGADGAGICDGRTDRARGRVGGML